MTPQESALVAAWIAELWPVVREVPRHHREEKQKADRVMQRALEEAHLSSTGYPQLSTSDTPVCAQNGAEKVTEGAA
jgi:hypothetical protein